MNERQEKLLAGIVVAIAIVTFFSIFIVKEVNQAISSSIW